MEVIRLNEDDINVTVIDGRGADWKKRAKELLKDRRNFLLIVPQAANVINAVDELTGYAPTPLPRWQINSVVDLVSCDDSALLGQAQDRGDFVFLVENLKRPQVRPPNAKPYVAYCELRGIVGEADSLQEAHDICTAFSGTIKKAKARPFVRVHQWNGNSWKPVNPFGC